MERMMVVWATACTASVMLSCSTVPSGGGPAGGTGRIRVLVWSEGTAPGNVYPNDINAAVAEGLRADAGLDVRTAALGEPGQGLTEEALAAADVLVWWGHAKHDKVTDENTARIVRHVRERGMGFIALHSAHYSKPFRALLGTPCDLGGWREDGKPEHIFVIEPSHPIARGLDAKFGLPAEEMYCERFVVPTPETVVFLSSFAQGEVFRSGCCWRIGKGRVFYFRPGHETHPTYFDATVRKVIRNAAYWSAGREAP